MATPRESTQVEDVDLQVRGAQVKGVLDKAAQVRDDQLVKDAQQVSEDPDLQERIKYWALNKRVIRVLEHPISPNPVVQEVLVDRVHKVQRVPLGRPVRGPGAHLDHAVRPGPVRQQVLAREVLVPARLASLLASRALGPEAMIGSLRGLWRMSLNLA